MRLSRKVPSFLHIVQERLGASVPFSFCEFTTNSLVGKQGKGSYLSQSLKPEIFKKDFSRSSGYPTEGSPAPKSLRKHSLSKISILSTGDVTEGSISFTSSSLNESHSPLHGFGEIEEQEVFEISSRHQQWGKDGAYSSMRSGRGISANTSSLDVHRENSLERDEEEDSSHFVPPHLLVQRDTQSLFERPCSKRMINWT